MPESSTPPAPGSIVWQDLTIPNATPVSQFYASVVGWTAKPHPMKGYDDYEMLRPADNSCVAGVCHARGSNANIPPQWLIYIKVASVTSSVQAALAAGGKVLDGPRNMGGSNFAVLQDPAGAVFAIID